VKSGLPLASWITSYVVASATPRCKRYVSFAPTRGTGIRSYEGFDPCWEMESVSTAISSAPREASTLIVSSPFALETCAGVEG